MRIKEMYFSIGEELRNDTVQVQDFYMLFDDAELIDDSVYGKCTHVMTEEELKAIKKHNYYKKCEKLGVSTDGIYEQEMFDNFACITNLKVREDLTNLQKDFEKNRNYLMKGWNVECKGWGRWLFFNKKRLNIEKEYTTYVEYGSKHYADWQDRNALIIDMNDYYLHGVKGKILRYSAKTDYAMNCYLQVNQAERGFLKQGMDINEIAKNYAKCFYFIVCKGHNGSFEDYFYHVMWFLWKTIQMKECSISPMKVYMLCKLQYFGVHQKPYRPTVKNKHKRWYIEEGYTKKIINDMLNETKMNVVALAIMKLNNTGQKVTVENLRQEYMRLGGEVRKSKNNRYTGLEQKGTISHNTIRALLEKMKTISEYSTLVNNAFFDNWKDYIDLDKKTKDNYSEIAERFPNVTMNAYKIARSRMKKQTK